MAFLGLDTAARRSIFVVYMALWVSYGLLNQRAKRIGITFDSTTAVIVQCCFKLMISTYMFIQQDGNFETLIDQFQKNKRCLKLYIIPAGLYGAYDVLSYVNLRHFDPSTYFLLLQFRLVLTGIIHERMFQKKLNRNQWLALLVTTAGCIFKTLQDQSPSSNSQSDNNGVVDLVWYGLLMVQMFSSTTAGIYNELLLKNEKKISLNLQNIFMYIDSVLVLLIMNIGMALFGEKSVSEISFIEKLQSVLTLDVLPMMIIMASVGVVTSIFLKQLDSIRKAIASALELVLLPFLSFLFFGSAISGGLLVSVMFVSSGVYLYSIPVEEPAKPSLMESDTEDDEDLEGLIQRKVSTEVSSKV